MSSDTIIWLSIVGLLLGWIAHDVYKGLRRR